MSVIKIKKTDFNLFFLRISVIVFAIFFGQLSGQAFAFSKNSEIINRIESKYKSVHSISAYFFQKEIIPGYSQNMAYSGYFYYKYPDKMTWVDVHPIRKKQILRGDRLFIVDNKLKKVTEININSKAGGFPPNVIAVLGNLTKYFSVERIKIISKSGIVRATLKPLKLQRAKVIYVDFAANDYKIVSMKILTYQGQTIVFQYKNMKFNVYLKDDIFSDSFPKNYNIIKEKY